MKSLLLTIQTLALLLSIQKIYCQNGFINQDIFRPQNMPSQDYQVQTIIGYGNNALQRDPSSQSVSSVNVQYTNDDVETEDARSRPGRSRKVYRIKNPFQKPNETENDPSVKDSDAGASNQYAAMQYSLPPEEFLQQMKVERQYYQQQSQGSTPAPSTGYSSTPQPQYQYSTINSPNYHNNNQQLNQVVQIDRKPSQAQSYYSTYNPYQYNNLASYASDGVLSTPFPPYLSTPSNNQFVGTPANSYSSSSPVLLSSPPNLQQYISSPSSVLQTGGSDYNIKSATSTSSNPFNYESNDVNKRMQIDHYDNSVNGMQYPTNLQQQYRNDFLQSTSIPTISDNIHDNWRQLTDVGVNELSKPFQDVSFPQYSLANTQQENNYNINSGNVNFDSQRIGSYPSANNMYLNFAQSDSQMLNSLKNYARDLEHEIGRSEIYSHGDYGWKLQDKKSFNNRDEYSTIVPQHNFGLNSDNNRAVSQMTFHMDTSNSQNNYEAPPKSGAENSGEQAFVKAATKAHENMKRQQTLYLNNIDDNFSPNYNPNPSSSLINNNKQINNLMSDSDSYSYKKPADIITVSPFNHLSISKDNFDGNVKQPFDHARALKNIVPIDVSNGIINSDPQQVKPLNQEGNKYSVTLNKDQTEQIKQYYKPVSDAFYRDKNTGYGINIKIKPDDSFLMNNQKQKDHSVLYNEKYTNLQSEQSPHNRYLNNNNHYSDETPQNLNYAPLSTYQQKTPVVGHIQQNSHHPQSQSMSDLASILKFNDIPYKIAHGISLNNNHDQINIPTPIPPRINQSVGSHQIDVTSSILSKLLSAKQPALNINKPELDTQPNGLISTINGFRVANPYNVDLKLVAEMLKGKTFLDEFNTRPLREQFNKPSPLKLDISHLQELFKIENDFANPVSSNIGFGINPYSDIYNIGRFPYQGVKYSRSQEEEESIPIASDSTNDHPIGAVVEQDDLISGQEGSTGTDVTNPDEESITNSLTEDRPEVLGASPNRALSDRPRHPNSLFQGRHTPKRKYPKTRILEPYPLLKPPAPQSSRFRNNRNKYENTNYRRRNNKRKINHVLKNTEPLFEANTFIEEDAEPKVPILLRPPPVPEEKSDDNIDDSEES